MFKCDIFTFDRPSLPRSRQPPGSLVMKAIKEANQSVAMKPRRGHGQIEIERADDFVERKVELKRGGIKLNEKTTLIVQENEADNKVDNEIEASELENSAKRKDHGEEEKPQVPFGFLYEEFECRPQNVFFDVLFIRLFFAKYVEICSTHSLK